MSVATFRITQPDGTVIEGEGAVEVLQPPVDDARRIILAWLDNLDPVVIEQAALDRSGWGSASLAAEIINTLRHLATADA